MNPSLASPPREHLFHLTLMDKKPIGFALIKICFILHSQVTSQVDFLQGVVVHNHNSCKTPQQPLQFERGRPKGMCEAKHPAVLCCCHQRSRTVPSTAICGRGVSQQIEWIVLH